MEGGQLPERRRAMGEVAVSDQHGEPLGKADDYGTADQCKGKHGRGAAPCETRWMGVDDANQ